jgi:hypothetical protein
MTTGPPGPGEPPGPGGAGEPAGRAAPLTALWALALARFRDYLHWVTEAAGDPRHDRGGSHDPDR